MKEKEEIIVKSSRLSYWGGGRSCKMGKKSTVVG